MLDAFMLAEQANRERYAREALERLRRERMWKRKSCPMEAGGLFDEVTRSQAPLFGDGK